MDFGSWFGFNGSRQGEEPPQQPKPAGAREEGRHSSHRHKQSHHRKKSHDRGGSDSRAGEGRHAAGRAPTSTGGAGSKGGHKAARKEEETVGTPQRSRWGPDVSALCGAALDKLEGLSGDVAKLEDAVNALEAELAAGGLERPQLLQMKDMVAQIHGTLEKLQYGGVDSVVVADLDPEGQDMCRAKRKALNVRCERIREKLSAISEAIRQRLQHETKAESTGRK